MPFQDSGNNIIHQEIIIMSEDIEEQNFIDKKYSKETKLEPNSKLKKRDIFDEYSNCPDGLCYFNTLNIVSDTGIESDYSFDGPEFNGNCSNIKYKIQTASKSNLKHKRSTTLEELSNQPLKRRKSISVDNWPTDCVDGLVGF